MRSEWKKALSLNPRQPEIFNNLGNAYSKLNQHREAIETWQKILDITPDSSEVYFKLGSAYGKLDDLNKAIASRLQYATDSDSSKNAITLLDMYSSLVPMLLEDQLAEIRGFFSAFLPADEIKTDAPSNNYLEKAKAFVLEFESDLALAPIENADNNSDSDVPAWLRGSFDDEEKKPAAGKVADTSAIDAILSASSLSLSLEPTETPPERPSGKAIFTMADDEPPPKPR